MDFDQAIAVLEGILRNANEVSPEDVEAVAYAVTSAGVEYNINMDETTRLASMWLLVMKKVNKENRLSMATQVIAASAVRIVTKKKVNVNVLRLLLLMSSISELDDENELSKAKISTLIAFVQALFADGKDATLNNSFVTQLIGLFGRFIKKCPLIVSQFLCELKTNETAMTIFALKMLPAFNNSSNEETKKKVRSDLIDSFRKRVNGSIKSSSPCLDLYSQRWNPLLQSLTDEEWEGEDGLASVLLKAMKKSSESFAKSFVSIVSRLSRDTSCLVTLQQGGFMPLALRLLKSVDMIQQQYGIEMIIEVTRRLSSAAAMETIIGQLLGALHGKIPGVLTVSLPPEHMRSAILFAYLRLILTVSSNGNEETIMAMKLQTGLPLLWTAMEKENDVNLHALYGHVITINLQGMLLLRSSPIAAEVAMGILNETGQKITNNAAVTGVKRMVYLSILSSFVTSNSTGSDTVIGETMIGMVTRVPALITIAKDGPKRTGVAAFDAILASSILFSLSSGTTSSAGGGAVSEGIVKHKLVEAMLYEGGMINQTATMEALCYPKAVHIQIMHAVSSYSGSVSDLVIDKCSSALLMRSTIAAACMAIGQAAAIQPAAFINASANSTGIMKMILRLMMAAADMGCSSCSDNMMKGLASALGPSYISKLLSVYKEEIISITGEEQLKRQETTKKTMVSETMIATTAAPSVDSKRQWSSFTYRSVLRSLLHPCSNILFQGNLHMIELGKELASVYCLSLWLASHPLLSPSDHINSTLAFWKNAIMKIEYRSLNVQAFIRSSAWLCEQIASFMANQVAGTVYEYDRIAASVAVTIMTRQLSRNNNKNLTIFTHALGQAIKEKIKEEQGWLLLLTSNAEDLALLNDPEAVINAAIIANAANAIAAAESSSSSAATMNETSSKRILSRPATKKGAEEAEWLEKIKREKKATVATSRQSSSSSSSTGPQEEESAQAIDNLRSRLSSLQHRIKTSLGLIKFVELLSSGLHGHGQGQAQAMMVMVFESIMQPVISSGHLWSYLTCPATSMQTMNMIIQPIYLLLLLSSSSSLSPSGNDGNHEGEMKERALDLAASLRIAMTNNTAANTKSAAPVVGIKSKGEKEALPDCMTRVLRSLSSSSSSSSSSTVTSDGSSKAATTNLLLVWPVLRWILTSTDDLAMINQTFAVLEKLWDQCTTSSSSNSNSNSGGEGLRNLISPIFSLCLFLSSRILLSSSNKLPLVDFMFAVIQSISPLTIQEMQPLFSEQGLLQVEIKARLLAIESLLFLAINSSNEAAERPQFSSEMMVILRLTCFDEVNEIKQAAVKLWSILSIDNERLEEEQIEYLSSFLSSAVGPIRRSASEALAVSITAWQSSSSSFYSSFMNTLLQERFMSARPPPSTAAMVKGVKKEVIPEDTHALYRLAVAMAMMHIGRQKLLTLTNNSEGGLDRHLRQLLSFILQEGVIDSHAEVKQAMIDSAAALVTSYGLQQMDGMLALLEDILARSPSNEELVTAFDNRKAAAVVTMGTLARHMTNTSNGERQMKVLSLLLETLKIPSESVQRAVSDCLHPLVQILKANEAMPSIVESLFNQVTTGSSYGDRRGAAFGLAATIKGLGIASLKQYNIVPRLKEICQVGNVNARQGALFAFECLADRLGLLFEPYLVSIIESLLQSFSHSSDHVRDAARGATKLIMSKLSAHGVKQVLAPVIAMLSPQVSWKSRQEALKMLGSMSNLAPKQLAASLPQIVPTLVAAGSDSHPKVKESAKAATAEIAAVIRNPEIAQLSPILLSALADPAKHTKDALEALLDCEFLHSIDSASLALLIPILSRALKDRGADLKRKAAAICGNMVTMASEPKAMSPYISQILPGLKECIIDPIPDVRASGARAMGRLYEGIANDNTAEGGGAFNELLPWLLSTLTADASPVERSGAAQGLAEICGCCNDLHLTEALLAKVMIYKDDHKACAREGLMWTISFLPYTLRETFARYIDMTLPIVLTGLSDDHDGVREVAMRAGKVIVSVLGLTHAILLAPPLLKAIGGEGDYRIRNNSLQLLGELLLSLGNLTNHTAGDTIEETEETSSGSNKAILDIQQVLGRELTHLSIASIYISRCDIALPVRQQALNIWKALISSTPRTLLMIMPVLVHRLVSQLSANEEELRVVAGRAIGELVSKLGDKVLPSIVEPLNEGLIANRDNEEEEDDEEGNEEEGEESEDDEDENEIEDEKVSTRLGVCLGLSEVLSSCSRKQAEDFISPIIQTVLLALCDASAKVCEQAAKAFLSLYKTLGKAAVDEILPVLLRQLVAEDHDNDRDEEEEEEEVEEEEDQPMPSKRQQRQSRYALRGLRAIVKQRPRDMLDYLLPLLLTSTMSQSQAKALAAILAARQAFPLLPAHYPSLVTCLVSELIHHDHDTGSNSNSNSNARMMAALADVGQALSLGITQATNGVHLFLLEAAKQIEHDSNAKRRQWGLWLLTRFLTQALDNDDSSSLSLMADYGQLLLKLILSRCDERDSGVLNAAREALVALTSVSRLNDSLLQQVPFMQTILLSAASTIRYSSTAAFATVTASASTSSSTSTTILPLFAIPKGLDPLALLLVQGLQSSSLPPHLRQQCAALLAEVLALSDPIIALKPLLPKLAGPLIRVLSEKGSSSIRAGTLTVLKAMLSSGQTAAGTLRAFAPQLQSSFVKSLNDPLREARQAAVGALGALLSIGAVSRVDPLLTELTVQCRSAEAAAVKLSLLQALSTVLKAAGEKGATASGLDKARAVVMPLLFEEDDNLQEMAGRCIGMIAACYPAESAAAVEAIALELLAEGCGGNVKELEAEPSLLSDEMALSLAGRLIGLAHIYRQAAHRLLDEAMATQIVSLLAVVCRNEDRVAVQVAVGQALGAVWSLPHYASIEASATAAGTGDQSKRFAQAAARRLGPEAASLLTATSRCSSSAARGAILSAIRKGARNVYGALTTNLSVLVHAVSPLARDIDLRVKYLAERCLRRLCESTGNAATNQFTQYLSSPIAGGSGEAETQRWLRDFYSRTLNRLTGEDSDQGEE